MEKIRIGRDGSNEIVVPEGNDHVSNFHAEITKSDDGTYTFEDRSTNGTKINGVTVHQQVVAISPGDEIILAGQYHLLWNEIESPLSSRKTVINVQRNPSGQSDSGNVQNVNPSEGMLWNSRYRLIKRLGNGATAQVWEATDTKAGNIKVAVKIFSAFGNIGTRGMQIFEKEFTSVHGLIQTNLLIPNSYDTYGNIPYLVSNYCEKGSAQSLVGRMGADDLVNFMKDTAQGLDYLHKHGIVHQDIKPDNILIDANDNFVLTDFGISNQSETKNINGTPAYMGPERYGSNPVSIPESDIWSFGATVFEMITGDVPFGDNGGVVQAAGEKIPEFPASFKSKTIKNLVVRCLDPEPENRPTAEEILLELEDTGGRKKMWLIAAAVAALVAIVSLVVWNHLRLKTVYYADYVEYWGIPHGVHELSGSEVAHRGFSYRFMIKKGKVLRVSLVNSKDKIIDHNDTESKKDRYADVRYEYSGDGKYLDYMEVYDPHGKLLYVLDYDAFQNKHTTASYKMRRGDEMYDIFLDANTTDLRFEDKNQLGEAFSNINKLSVDYDDTGRMIRKTFRSGNNPAHDADNIYGSEYEYDDMGRKIEERFLGRNGQIVGNKEGLAIKVYKYDEKDNLVEYNYLNSEREAAKDPYGAIVLKCTFDEYGNRMGEQYLTLEGQPMYCGYNFHRSVYVIDENGNTEQVTYLDTAGKPMINKYGYATRKMKYDENGFECEQSQYDENSNSTNFVNENGAFHKVVTKNDSTGLYLEVSYYDIYGEPVAYEGDVSTYKYEYDENGNCTQLTFFDTFGQKVKVTGEVCQYRRAYDAQSYMISESYYDAEGNPAPDDRGIYSLTFERDAYGRLVKYTLHDKDGGYYYDSENGYAYFTQKYDDYGNLAKVEWFDADGQPSSEGNASREYVYDQATNFKIRTVWRDKDGVITDDYYYEYDNVGNNIKKYTLDRDKKLDGVVTNYEYDNQRRETKSYATDLNGNRINFDDESYCEVRYEKYDEFNNCCVRSYWDKNGNPATYKPGVHKYVQEFDYRGKPVHEISYGIDGNPAKIDDVEGKVVYDVRGNMTELYVYDGYGKPRLGSDGFHKKVMSYNNKNEELSCEYYDTDLLPIVPPLLGYHKRQYTYDDKGNMLTEEYFDKNNNPMINADKGYFKEQYTYNDKGKVIKMEYYGTSNQSINENKVWAKIVYTYDDNGNITQKEWFSTKQREQVYKYVYNDKNKTTEQLQFDGSGNQYWRITFNEDGNTKERFQYDGKKNWQYKYVVVYAKDNKTPSREDVYDASGKRLAYRNYFNGWGDYQKVQQSQPTNSWLSVFKNTRWPYKWNSDYTITKCTVSGNTVTCWIQAVNVSKYQSDKESGVRSAVSNIKSALNSQGNGKPSNFILRINVIDKAGRDWFSM